MSGQNTSAKISGKVEVFGLHIIFEANSKHMP